ncbi:hypothetical protein CLV51_101816 [Chitinophaga niastensis]|uniref:HEAT repeat domain-containing protein n=1 Tax=Chitinophaga niastensis TaxID=536980 RepID=A0A2P8HTF7_CHINA|nr:hypothetical protein [Chitinophaga niastensis]PSL49482.1 hypothetical protein CLV51_101816 [Chitinophaga niastensis]
MSVLEQFIKDYQATTDDDKKADIIRNEFEYLNDNNKWRFLSGLLKSKYTYDLVKVAIYRIIEVADFADPDLVEIKDQILYNLKDEEDELVKQWGFRSLTWNFSVFPDVIDYCVDTVENVEEDLDVRHNAFSVITASKNKERIDALHDRLLKIKDFAGYANTFYKERDKDGR